MQIRVIKMQLWLHSISSLVLNIGGYLGFQISWRSVENFSRKCTVKATDMLIYANELINYANS